MFLGDQNSPEQQTDKETSQSFILVYSLVIFSSKLLAVGAHTRQTSNCEPSGTVWFRSLGLSQCGREDVCLILKDLLFPRDPRLWQLVSNKNGHPAFLLASLIQSTELQTKGLGFTGNCISHPHPYPHPYPNSATSCFIHMTSLGGGRRIKSNGKHVWYWKEKGGEERTWCLIRCYLSLSLTGWVLMGRGALRSLSVSCSVSLSIIICLGLLSLWAGTQKNTWDVEFKQDDSH